MTASRRGVRASARFNQWLSAIVLSAVVLTPIIVVPHFKEPFRTPKEIFVRALAILAGALLALEAIRRGSLRKITDWRAIPLLFAAAILAWSGIAAITSTNRLVSGATLLRITSCVVLFVATFIAARRLTPVAVALAMIPAAINVGVFYLQDFRIWNPFISQQAIQRFLEPSGRNIAFEAHQFSTGLLGNVDDVGDYLALSAIGSAALLAIPRYRRAMAPLLAATIVGVLLTRSIIAIGAIIVGLILSSWVVSRRAGIATIITLTVGLVLAPTMYLPLRARVSGMIAAATSHDWNALLSNRLPPFLAALAMARDHLLTGVGPGCFAFQYVPYRQTVDASHPSLLDVGEVGVNFGEVHNDYLQTLAEGGLPALGILIAALVVLGMRSRPADIADDAPPSEILRVGQRLALPLSGTFSVLAFGHFPLELAGPMTLFLFLAALSWRWTERSNG